MKIRLCINTQTPIVRFKKPIPEQEKAGPVRLEDLAEGSDYAFSPGGVTAMVYPLVNILRERGVIEDPRWISLGPGAPAEVTMGGIKLYNVSLEQSQLAGYTNFKEGIWNEVHGLGSLSFRGDEYEAYALYNWMSAKLMLEMLRDIDVFWIHDFQQLLIGNMIGPSAPAVLRWHVPFRLEGVSERLRALVLKSIEAFDSIIVSTKRDLEGLIHAGYRGRAQAIYPYVDSSWWNSPSASATGSVRSKLGLRESDRVIMVVARMDPIKSQDVAIRALSHLRREVPDARLVLVGNGSFTGSSTGGLGHPKATDWRSRLMSLTEELSLQDRVVFAGHLTHDEIASMYTASEVIAVPSRLEGFNLTAVEGWLHKKPCVVSKGAGVSELVQNGINGFVFNPGNDLELAEKIKTLLRSSEAASKMGEIGSMTATVCDVNSATDSIQEIFEREIARYSG